MHPARPIRGRNLRLRQDPICTSNTQAWSDRASMHLVQHSAAGSWRGVAGHPGLKKVTPHMLTPLTGRRSDHIRQLVILRMQGSPSIGSDACRKMICCEAPLHAGRYAATMLSYRGSSRNRPNQAPASKSLVIVAGTFWLESIFLYQISELAKSNWPYLAA